MLFKRQSEYTIKKYCDAYADECFITGPNVLLKNYESLHCILAYPKVFYNMCIYIF